MTTDKKEKDKTPSPAKLETERKYGEGAINEFKIRDTKSDPTLFYLVNAIDKDVRVEACKEILKRALTDIYFGINETELVKQEDLVRYIHERKAPKPTKQWMFSVDSNREAKEFILESTLDFNNQEDSNDNYSESSIVNEEDVHVVKEKEIEAEIHKDDTTEISSEDISNGIKHDNMVVDDFEDDSPF